MTIQMEAFLAYNGFYLMGLLPLMLVFFLLFFYPLRMRTWYLTDLLLIVVPGVLYFLLDIVRADRWVGHSKTLANLVEPLYLGVGLSIIFGIRCLAGKMKPDYSRKSSASVLGIATVLTLAVYLLTPALPE